ncbi:hypothetical protein BDV10DRAFT_160781 [Aspergillus recurvatus]
MIAYSEVLEKMLEVRWFQPHRDKARRCVETWQSTCGLTPSVNSVQVSGSIRARFSSPRSTGPLSPAGPAYSCLHRRLFAPSIVVILGFISFSVSAGHTRASE